MAKCPICREAIKPRHENGTFPFCSSRCKMVDLGKWLNEEYRIPAGPAEDEAEGDSKTDPSRRNPVRH